MLTKLTIRNFKRFDEVEIELQNPVVFIGPNNSGKTSAMQALALWDIGLRRWREQRSRRQLLPPPGILAGLLATPDNSWRATINRRDLVAIPVPQARLLWRNLSTLGVSGLLSPSFSDIHIEIVVEGASRDRHWTCGLEFTHVNEESLYCRPLRMSDQDAEPTPPFDAMRFIDPGDHRSDDGSPERMPIPEEAEGVQIAFLPPMSGLAANEIRLDRGAVNVRIGEGRTAEVLRNLCLGVHEKQPSRWEELVDRIQQLFGAELGVPQYIVERGEIAMSYRERGIEFDLSSSGRGLQQTLLLLAYMYANPGAVLLLDEPDAHLEVLRQRQTYQLLTDVADDTGSQIIAASHSEVLLDEAARQGAVVAFVGKPHSVKRGSQVLKALKEIPFDHYSQAEQTGWVLYLEGSTDLSMLRAFARRLEHQPALDALDRPFVYYVGNQVRAVRRHYHGLREACPDLRGVALFDRLEKEPRDISPATLLMWKRREVENYICSRATLEAYAATSAPDDTPTSLFTASNQDRRVQAMRDSITEIESAMRTLDEGSPWDADIKASDKSLNRIFKACFRKLDLPNLMAKKNYHQLVQYVPDEEIDSEITEKLDAIAAVAEAANPAGEPE
jgi:hypothetical protein